MHPPALSTSLLRSAWVAAEFESWLSTSGDDLLDAVDLLGGPTWIALARRTLAAAATGELVRHLPQLRRLRRLLRLELVDHCEEAAARFLSVHPDDPRADNARLCAEALDRGIRALESVTPVRSEAA